MEPQNLKNAKTPNSGKKGFRKIIIFMYLITAVLAIGTVQEFLTIKTGTSVIAEVQSIQITGPKNDRKVEIYFKYKNLEGLNIEDKLFIPSLAYDPKIISHNLIRLKLSSSGMHHQDSYKEAKYYSILCCLMMIFIVIAEIRMRRFSKN